MQSYLYLAIGILAGLYIVAIISLLTKSKKNQVGEVKKEEIERKFLIHELPDHVKLDEWQEVHQTYLAIGEEELRIRAVRDEEGETYSMTRKNGLGMVRKESEFEIQQSTYDQLLSPTILLPLIKRRYFIEEDGKKYDLDIYENAAEEGLITLEIEFASVAEAEAFVPLEWFGEEVTEDESYKNQNIWRAIQVESL